MIKRQAVVITRRQGRKQVKKEVVEIPSDDVLKHAAAELRQAGAGKKAVGGHYDSCIGIYMPSRDYHIRLRDFDIFTGARGDVREGDRGTIDESCGFWYGTDVRIAEAKYECDRVEINYYCKEAFGIQRHLFDQDQAKELSEGTPQHIEQTVYERDPRLRNLCVQHHGMRCAVCGIDFRMTYGELAAGFIHVHHLEPLSATAARHVVNPATDLLPVCPNCHSVIHLKNPPYTPDEVQTMLCRSQA